MSLKSKQSYHQQSRPMNNRQARRFSVVLFTLLSLVLAVASIR